MQRILRADGTSPSDSNSRSEEPPGGKKVLKAKLPKRPAFQSRNGIVSFN
jgi:hypothetical protein